MKEQLIQLLKRAPRPEAIASSRQAQEFKRFHADATKKLAKKMTETELTSLYSQTHKWY